MYTFFLFLFLMSVKNLYLKKLYIWNEVPTIVYAFLSLSLSHPIGFRPIIAHPGDPIDLHPVLSLVKKLLCFYKVGHSRLRHKLRKSKFYQRRERKKVENHGFAWNAFPSTTSTWVDDFSSNSSKSRFSTQFELQHILWISLHPLPIWNKMGPVPWWIFSHQLCQHFWDSKSISGLW